MKSVRLPRRQAGLRRRQPAMQASSTSTWGAREAVCSGWRRLRNGRHAISRAAIVVDTTIRPSSATLYWRNAPPGLACHERSPAHRAAQPALVACRAVNDRSVLDRRGVSGVSVDWCALRGGRRGVATADQRIPDHLRRDESVPWRHLRCDRSQAGDDCRHPAVCIGIRWRSAFRLVRDAAGLPRAAGYVCRCRSGGGARADPRQSRGCRRATADVAGHDDLRRGAGDRADGWRAAAALGWLAWHLLGADRIHRRTGAGLVEITG